MRLYVVVIVYLLEANIIILLASHPVKVRVKVLSEIFEIYINMFFDSFLLPCFVMGQGFNTYNCVQPHVVCKTKT